MKNLILILSIIMLVSCSSDDDSGDVNNNEFEEIETVITQGTWEVSNYIEGENSRTVEFESFIFTFNLDGTVVAQNDLFSEPGTWNYDNTSTTQENFNLQFTQTPPFDLISENWNIILVSNTQIQLAVTSGNNGEPETLTFIKI